jgi:hypothetical protein
MGFRQAKQIVQPEVQVTFPVQCQRSGETLGASASTHCLLVVEHVSHQQSYVVRTVLIWTASSSHDIGGLVENVENVSREVNDI